MSLLSPNHAPKQQQQKSINAALITIKNKVILASQQSL